MFTDLQKEQFLKSGGTRCPRCNSDFLFSNSIRFGSIPEEVEGLVHCNNCGLNWIDVYKIHDIRE